MNHYAKLATVVLRLFGITLFVLGAMGLLYLAGAAILGTELTPAIRERRAGGIWYVVAGIIVYLLSRPVGRFIGRDLD